MLTLPDWPPWALNTFIGCVCITLIAAIIQYLLDSRNASASKSDSNGQLQIVGDDVPRFRAFQRQYLLVYTIIMTADWFQGTNMYTLYSSYGVNISALFITGFLTGAVMAGPVGIMIDKFGRKRMCIVYLVLEIIINIMEHVNDFWILWLSRILGGITTNILFTGFEAWMNAEHRKRGFPQEWVADTFSKVAVIFGLSAIFAGVLAQFAADAMGEIGPFKCAIGLTALALVFVLGWEENYGGGDEEKDDKGESMEARAWTLIKTDRKVFLMGSVMALFEGSMYSFVFMWVPTMIAALGHFPPTGLVFASLMCCISLGGILSSPSMLSSLAAAEYVGVGCFLVGAAALLVPVFFSSLIPILGAFLVFEVCVGVWNFCGGVLRARVIPDELTGSVTNMFRVPLNSLVVIGTLLTDYMAARYVFGIITCWMLLAAGAQVYVIQELAKAKQTVGNGKKDK
jgi:MFS family permease|mmetsp:Transcript_24546/g.39366  ORF Transcript_24546/g.39366 Transcript_24546/m.39366 type:complete len:456 (-) Transcript_24546:232-1599(-)